MALSQKLARFFVLAFGLGLLLSSSACNLMLGPTTRLNQDFYPEIYPTMAVYVEDHSGQEGAEPLIEIVKVTAVDVVTDKGYRVPGSTWRVVADEKTSVAQRAIGVGRDLGASAILVIEVLELRSKPMASEAATPEWWDTNARLRARVLELKAGAEMWRAEDQENEAERADGVSEDVMEDLTESIVEIMPPRSSTWWL